MMFSIYVIFKLATYSTRKLLINFVDYQWEPIRNQSIELTIDDQFFGDRSTDDQGSIVICYRVDIRRSNVILLSVNEINQNITIDDEQITIRLSDFNENMSEAYDDNQRFSPV